MVEARTDAIRVGRVVSEDDKFVLLEVPKDMTEPVTLQEGDRFWTLVFVKAERPGSQRMVAWLPWAGT